VQGEAKMNRPAIVNNNEITMPGVAPAADFALRRAPLGRSSGAPTRAKNNEQQ
jgi:hypothetical protein